MSAPSRRVFRFAPSPNGYLHLGHAFSALMNFNLAREGGGRFLLRIEDIDRARSKPEYEAAIYEDLAWLGLDWERPVRRQSEHFSDYAEALERLDALGLLYPCDCTRGDIARHALRAFSSEVGTGSREENTIRHDSNDQPPDPDGALLYPGTCRAKERSPAREILSKGGVALRLDMGAALKLAPANLTWNEFGAGAIPAQPERWGDVVLARKDTPASYHLAVVVDDALQGVTDVVRGEDLFHATGLHRLLQHLLGLPVPDYRHHRLLRDTEGDKLSKSRMSRTLRDLRAEGAAPAEVRAMTGLR
ncbi:tRNA glutamyl-Q(34) synthetase GluQRS [Methylocystis heyeri]|uniref:tRNA glutamyl-Q(34) synthetase GluQRS n=1 Tax=Methylocystis heyeri TaxID=391905 RepID=A0A6B8KIQ0_9HYPH|nr:tRNA glutamyl-Q(34) synthetase GluQRS [Methylocystis heyeri]QGM47552.1 tRNA glutamyl-Q(34) synthetase GluQRS [Methylocystis heyeri]